MLCQQAAKLLDAEVRTAADDAATPNADARADMRLQTDLNALGMDTARCNPHCRKKMGHEDLVLSIELEQMIMILFQINTLIDK